MVEIPADCLEAIERAAGYASRRQREESDDLRQEGCLAVLHAIRKGNAVSPGLARFLTLQAAKLAIRRRTTAIRGGGIQHFEIEPRDKGHVPAIGDAVDIHEALAALNDDHQRLIVMNCIEGMTVREIGEALGISRTAASSRLCAARAAAIELLGDGYSHYATKTPPKYTDHARRRDTGYVRPEDRPIGAAKRRKV